MNTKRYDVRPRQNEHDDLADLARLAGIYGFPSYEMARLRFKELANGQSILNSLHHKRDLTSPANTKITATNADVIKSSAWLDLSREPLSLHVPDSVDRYYSVALMDFYSNNFAVLGHRAGGIIAGDFLLTGSRWDGAAPCGMTVISAPTNDVWVMVRILVHGGDDLAAAHAFQDQFRISPSGPHSGRALEGSDTLSLPVPEFDGQLPVKFFNLLNALQTANPPPSRDRPILDRLKLIGVGPSLRFKHRQFTLRQLHAVRRGLLAAWDTIRSRELPDISASRWPSDALLTQLRGRQSMLREETQAGRRSGWSRPSAVVGNFGTDYLLRARCALRGIGGLPSQDAMYFIAATDANGERLGGHLSYVLRFPAGGLPPVDGYWSLTVYQMDEGHRRWLVPNEMRRYSIGSHTPGLRCGDDGSLEILFQRNRPSAGAENNWLPTPAGQFQLTLRAYLPRRKLLDGTYAIPELRPQSTQYAPETNRLTIERTSGAIHKNLLSLDRLSDIARLAYIYGLPAYEVARLRNRALTLPRAGERLLPNTLLHSKASSTPKDAVVTAVNTDTILSRAWLDLSAGPLVIHVPETADRYYSLALMDAFTNNFAVLGRRSNHAASGDFLLAGPRWQGAAPGPLTLIRAPTNTVWALIRILVYGSDDAGARTLQNQFSISPLKSVPDAALVGSNPLSVPVPQLNSTNLLRFFDVLNAVLTENPPPASDKPVLDRLALIGVGPSLHFDRQQFTPAQRNALRRGIASASDTIQAQVAFRTNPLPQADKWESDALLTQLRGPKDPSGSRRDKRFGWSGPPAKAGTFGTDYLLRAQCALAGLGMLPRTEAIYFTTATDKSGAVLNGRERYVLQFPPGGLPPVSAFWSLTIYQTDENNRRWLVPNEIGRYSIGNHTPVLRYGSGGSLGIVIQHDRPGVNEENWLPAPEGPFLLTLRAYLPRNELLDGRYKIPELHRRSSNEI
jgi:hypothetical protein